ncbi:putative pentatricopeptide [Medicago truncatula]|uniref:Putative pentatricopeptide n=1 Tax=Medicago truncatula TaxID=3880 RepID=A0A396I0Q9_MEDTR|nr:putative pentatricopeptide [Medicago truncatula]
MSHMKFNRHGSSSIAKSIIFHKTIHQNPKPKHPQHFLSLLLNNPSPHYHFLQQLHSQIITSSLFHHYPFHNNLTSLLLFNNLIRSYSLSLFPHESLKFFTHTLNNLTHSLSLDSFTLTFLAHACANLDTTHFGFHLHCIVCKMGFENHVFVQTGLLHMYSNWGFLVDAAQVFGEMPDRNTVTWNVFISGLIKWGQLEFARSVFDRMVVRSVVSWTLVIDGYTRMNKPLKALALFRKMIEVDGIEPNEVTLLTVFPAIAHLGNVKMCESVHGYVEKRGFNAVDIRIGLEFFGKMVNDYGLVPDIKHYGCVIDMLGRAGRLGEAEKVALEVPHEAANDVIWRTLLGACSVHDNVEIGKRVTKKILEMEKGHGGDYVLMSNIFASVGRFKDVERLREMIDKRNVFKLPGYSIV